MAQQEPMTALQEIAPRNSTIEWLLRKRASARLAFLLRAFSMVAGAVLSLIWARLLLKAMGAELNGVFLTFLAIVQLGGMGDLGISSAMGVKVVQFVSRGALDECAEFLSIARGMIFALAAFAVAAFCIVSPWLPNAFRVVEVPGAGSLGLLFAVGGVALGLSFVAGYFNTLNYVLGNVVWPVLPVFLYTQAAAAGQILLAKWSVPLWGQYLWHIAFLCLGLLTAWSMLRVSHPPLANVLPIRMNRKEASSLLGLSLWSYLGTLGSLIYITTDQILVNAGFGAELVPSYRFNYKLCELGIGFLSIATFVALPVMVQKILNRDHSIRQQGIIDVSRLQRLQATAAVAGGLLYLGANDAFIRLWLGPDMRMPLMLQLAFALTFVVTIAGDVGVQLLGRVDTSAIRIAGLTIAGTALVNLALSAVAVRLGSMLGIAFATVFAQSLATFIMSYHTCKYLGVSWPEWMRRAWGVPISAVLIGGIARITIGTSTYVHVIVVAAVFVIVLALAAVFLGVKRNMITEEWSRIRTVFE